MPSATSTQTNLCLAVQNGQLHVYQFLFGQVQTVNYQFVCSPRQNDKSQPASVRPAVPKMSYRRDIWSTVVDGSIKNGQPFWWNRQRHYSRGPVPLVFLTKFRPPGRHAMWATIVCDPTTFTPVADLTIVAPIAWYSTKPTSTLRNHPLQR